ncbi:hypothetical protein SJ307_22845, partial [Providencia rettgeri]|nr:hypothetical protein [Providencia rettgeri]
FYNNKFSRYEFRTNTVDVGMPLLGTASASFISTAFALGLATASMAAASTAKGQISVTQVMAMLDQASSNPTAGQVLTAYLAGVGETAAIIIDLA